MSSKNLYRILNIYYFPDANDAEKYYQKALEEYQKTRKLNQIKYNNLLDQFNNASDQNTKTKVLRELEKISNEEKNTLNNIELAFKILSNPQSKRRYDEKNSVNIIEELVINSAKELKSMIEVASVYYNFNEIEKEKYIDAEYESIKKFYEEYILSFFQALKVEKNDDKNSISHILQNLIKPIKINLDTGDCYNIDQILYLTQFNYYKKNLYKYIAECINFIILYYEIYYEIKHDPYKKEYQSKSFEIDYENINILDSFFNRLTKKIKEQYKTLLEHEIENQKTK